MLNYLQRWIDQLRWQRLKPFQKLAEMLLDHLDGILNYCRTKVPLGVVEAINGNIKSLLRRGRGYKNLRYLLLKAQRMAATRTEFVVFKKSGLKCGSCRILAQSRKYFSAENCIQRKPGNVVHRVIRLLSLGDSVLVYLDDSRMI